MKNKYLASVLIIVALVGIAGAVWWSKSNVTEPTGNNSVAHAEDPVATLHGGATIITRGELDAQIQELSQNPQIQVPDAADTEGRTAFERLVLDQMIGGILLFNEAEKQGFTADDTLVETELSSITAQYETAAAFEAELAKAKLSRETLRENIRRALITNQYYAKITTEHPVTVTDEEIRAFYDTAVAPQDETSVFENVEADIKTHLEQQKMQEILTGIVAELQQSADVQILL